MSNPEAVEMEGQAERWFVRLQERDCTEEERTTCARWRAADPRHEIAFREAENIWQRSAELGSDPLIVAELSMAERNKAPRRWRVWRWAVIPLAAGAAVLVSLTPRTPTAPDPLVMKYHTNVGERRRIDLPDGTAVVLDTHTDLAVRYSDKSRLIDLAQGQAQFEVAHDTRRPFVVRAAGGSVTATGTQFDVRVLDTTVTVTLLEGSVVVEAPSDATQLRASATLSPGQRLRFDRAGREWEKAWVDLESAGAWIQGSVRANDWPLTELVAEMNRYSTMHMRVADPTLGGIRISGTFRAGDQDALVLVLEHSWPVRAERVDGEIVLSRRVNSRR